MVGGQNMTQNHQITLNIIGMTCAACSNRIEKRLNKIDGVHAQVNRQLKKQPLIILMINMK